MSNLAVKNALMEESFWEPILAYDTIYDTFFSRMV